MTEYGGPAAGLPPQHALMTQRAVFTEAYAVLPRGTQRDIVTSAYPGWQGARAWQLARPMTGFAETFAQSIVELAPGGGSDTPEPDPEAEAVVFVTSGTVEITVGKQTSTLDPGGYAYVPPGADWRIWNRTDRPAQFHWVRKHYEFVPDLPAPDPFVTNEQQITPIAMPDSDGRWATTRFVDPDDLRHDMHVNIVTLEPGGTIPFEETHVMEHGLYVLQGKAVYRLNRDWVEVEAGDFMWLRAFCPQACYAGGPGRFRYLLYKDVNRHPKLVLP